MASTELTRPEQLTLMQRLRSMEGRMSTLKEKAQSAASDIQHKGMVFASGFVLGMLEGRAEMTGRAMPSAFGIDPKLLYGGIAYGVSQYAGGDVAKVGKAAAEAIVGIWGHEMGREQGRRAPQPGQRVPAPGPRAPGAVNG